VPKARDALAHAGCSEATPKTTIARWRSRVCPRCACRSDCRSTNPAQLATTSMSPALKTRISPAV